jgi:uncharacterized protein YgiM (DUF1202 family)
MLRLTLLLIAGMFGALYTLGEDKGQLRPGLALAEREGRLDEVWAEARSKAERVSAPAPIAQPKPVVAEVAPLPEPLTPAPTVVADIDPVVEVEPGREVVAMVEEPVFSLTAYGNEPMPGEDAVAAENVAGSVPEALPSGDGTIWYVNASSVNVRAEPSTDAEVLGKLGNGEAALMVASVDGEWARIVIQGDGMEGYVALRYLSAEAP